MSKWTLVLCFILFFALIQNNHSLKAQNTDTIPVEKFKESQFKPPKRQKKPYDFRGKPYNPALAGGLSAALPGLGQVYNRSYWKLPIVYAGLGTGGYFIYYFSVKMKDADNIIDKNNFRRSLDIVVIATTLWYTLNIIEAVVDAHLSSFDISDDLSLKITPVFEKSAFGKGFQNGIKLCFKF